MRINQIQNNHICYKPNFKAYSTTVYDTVTHRFKYDTTTCFARRDFEWLKFFEFISDKYKNTNKVNVISHACSDGEETYTLAAGLFSKMQDIKKFFPVFAKDIDKKNLKIASEGEYDIGKFNELGRIIAITGKNYKNCFQLVPDSTSENCDIVGNIYNKSIFNDTDYIRIKATKNLKDNIIFQQADMLQDLENIPPENTILMLRNVWPYFGHENISVLVKKLAAHLKPSSTLAIGLYDAVWKVEEELLQAGFKKTPVRLVYEM